MRSSGARRPRSLPCLALSLPLAGAMVSFPCLLSATGVTVALRYQSSATGWNSAIFLLIWGFCRREFFRKGFLLWACWKIRMFASVEPCSVVFGCKMCVVPEVLIVLNVFHWFKHTNTAWERAMCLHLLPLFQRGETEI